MKGFIIITGTTGAGKTTHAKILSKIWGIPRISTGDIARQFMDGATAQEFAVGRLSPHEDKIREAVASVIDGHQVVFLDGFPRTPEQDAWMRERWPEQTRFTILLDWPEKVLVNRWVSRKRDEFDSPRTFFLRDELYKTTIAPLFAPDVRIKSEGERSIFETSMQIRVEVEKWIRKTFPGRWHDVVPEDSPLVRAIDKFVDDHYVSRWRDDRLTTFAMTEEDVRAKLWEIVSV